MDKQRVVALQEKIEKAKKAKNKAEGALEAIQEQWEDKYGFSTVEEAEEQLEHDTRALEKLESKRDALLEEVEEMVKENA